MVYKAHMEIILFIFIHMAVIELVDDSSSWGEPEQAAK